MSSLELLALFTHTIAADMVAIANIIRRIGAPYVSELALYPLIAMRRYFRKRFFGSPDCRIMACKVPVRILSPLEWQAISTYIILPPITPFQR
jgi:hypothetical protein